MAWQENHWFCQWLSLNFLGKHCGVREASTLKKPLMSLLSYHILCTYPFPLSRSSVIPLSGVNCDTNVKHSCRMYRRVPSHPPCKVSRVNCAGLVTICLWQHVYFVGIRAIFIGFVWSWYTADGACKVEIFPPRIEGYYRVEKWDLCRSGDVIFSAQFCFVAKNPN